jgi:hypothetical protein
MQAIGMMRYLTLGELIELHRRIIAQSGGADGTRNLGLAESALAQPQMTFGGTELYPALAEKAAALCFSLASSVHRRGSRVMPAAVHVLHGTRGRTQHKACAACLRELPGAQF